MLLQKLESNEEGGCRRVICVDQITPTESVPAVGPATFEQRIRSMNTSRHDPVRQPLIVIVLLGQITEVAEWARWGSGVENR